jgi:hypothetical protein
MKKLDIASIKTDAYLAGICEERERISGIIRYIISKNTTADEDVWDEIVDYENLSKDLEELSSYLLRRVRESRRS